jgi:EamA domain-containing membrane protein RarD
MVKLSETFLILFFTFLFVGVPLMYYFTWGLNLDPGLSTALGFGISFVIGVFLFRLFRGEKILKARGGKHG